MRVSEVIGLIVFTLILFALLLPIPCIPPGCGPADAAPLTMLQTIKVYLYQPLSWIILLAWLVAIVVWLKRFRDSKND